MSKKGVSWSIEQHLGLSMEQFKEILDKSGTISAASVRLGITRKTTHKWAMAVGFTRPAGRPKMAYPTFSRKGEWGAVAKWLQNNPGAILPMDIHEAARVVGTTYSAVLSYIAFRKKKGLRYLHSLGDLKLMKLIFIDVHGKYIPTNRITEYALNLNGRTLELEITAKLGALGSTTIRTPMATFVNQVKRSKKALDGEVPNAPE